MELPEEIKTAIEAEVRRQLDERFAKAREYVESVRHTFDQPIEQKLTSDAIFKAVEELAMEEKERRERNPAEIVLPPQDIAQEALKHLDNVQVNETFQRLQAGLVKQAIAEAQHMNEIEKLCGGQQWSQEDKTFLGGDQWSENQRLNCESANRLALMVNRIPKFAE